MSDASRQFQFLQTCNATSDEPYKVVTLMRSLRHIADRSTRWMLIDAPDNSLTIGRSLPLLVALGLAEIEISSGRIYTPSNRLRTITLARMEAIGRHIAIER